MLTSGTPLENWRGLHYYNHSITLHAYTPYSLEPTVARLLRYLYSELKPVGIVGIFFKTGFIVMRVANTNPEYYNVP